MITANNLRAGMRVLDSDGDFVGTITGTSGDSVRIRQDGVVDGEHTVPLTRFSRTDGESVYLDGAWSTILTTLGGIAAGVGTAAAGMASTTAHAAENVGDRVKDAVTPDRSYTTTTRDHDVYVEPERKTNIWPWLLLGAAAIAAFLAMRSCNSEPVAVEPAPTDVAAPATPAGLESVTLPDNTKLDITPGTITYDLYKFVSGSDAAPKTFTFDKLNFDTGSSAIRAEDQPTIDSIGAIMKAYPNVKGSIVGYTDATGSAATNAKLSADRSANVMKAIVAKGVDAARLTSKSGGVANGGGANANARRTDLVVTSK